MGGGQQHERLFGDNVWTPGVGLLNIFGFWQFFVYSFQDFKKPDGNVHLKFLKNWNTRI
jgi:hypothetical protein